MKSAVNISFKSSFFEFILSISVAQQYCAFIALNQIIPLDSLSTDSDVFYVERSLGEQTSPEHKIPTVHTSMELSRVHVRDLITISPVTSLESNRVTIEPDTNEPTIPYGYGRQHHIIPPSLNNSNLPRNPFNVLATMVIVQPATSQYDERDSPLSLVPSELSSISTPPMKLKTVKGWDTCSYVGTFSVDDPRRNYSVSSPFSTTPPPRRQKQNLGIGIIFLKKGSVAAHLRRLRPARNKTEDNLRLRTNSISQTYI